jgi:hypothetical protein
LYIGVVSPYMWVYNYNQMLLFITIIYNHYL